MSNHARLLHLDNPSKRQCGQALLAMLVILVIGLSAAIYALVSPTRSTVERDKITTAALAQAKAALIGYAVGVSDFAGGERPGDLPCPDSNDSGAPGTPNCNTQVLRIGRLPWKSLGLDDLRDGDGERLWYAVSINFKNSTRTACTAPGAAGCLNSDSRGTITVRNNAGTVIHDGSNPDAFTPSGVVAVIFAPGAILQRQGAGAAQDRSCTGGSCTAAGVCTSTPLTNTPKCNPLNYLDVLSGTEDNAAFTDSSNSDGFINGVIRDASGNLIVNDRLITITYADLMPVLERRVAREAMNSLAAYASANNGRYPWAAGVGDVTSPYGDNTNERFGRLPDTLGDTLLGLGGGLISTVCSVLPLLCMSSNWPAAASITQGSWWMNWKEQVFYGVAEAYAPAVNASIFPLYTASIPASGGCGNCLLVNPPSAAIDKRVVVVVAGKRLSGVNGGQPRSSTGDKQDAANYLEGENGNNTATSYIYEDSPASTTFNDIVLYQ
jgi:type II secretory pathway pseudopilin PulG